MEGLNEAEKKQIEAEKKLYAFTQPSQATSRLDHRLKPLGHFYAAAEQELRALGESMRRNRERENVARDLAEVLGPRSTKPKGGGALASNNGGKAGAPDRPELEPRKETIRRRLNW